MPQEGTPARKQGVSVSDDEAKGVLRAEFIKLRALGYAELVERLADNRVDVEVVGLSGTSYHVELQGFWDNGERRELRVVASIDSGALRAFLPFTDSFTMDPAGVITQHSVAWMIEARGTFGARRGFRESSFGE